HHPEYFGLTTDEEGRSTAGLAELIVAKHRNGAVDTIKMRFRKEQAKFLDYDADDAFGYSSIESSMNNMGTVNTIEKMGQDGMSSGLDSFASGSSFESLGGSFEQEGDPDKSPF
ncbi:MAG: DnaB-like helicase C-terminal domain-containing protein, partial [Rikenellaceae bacterium]